MLEKYIEELIQRMNIEEKCLDSSTSISWKAYREAESISDNAFYPILKKQLLLNSKPKDKKYRQAVYFMLGKLLKNSPQHEYIIFYLQQMEKESNKYILSYMLDIMVDVMIPSDISVKIIVDLTMNEKWLIRHSAIRALGASSTSESKQALAYYINQEDVKTYKYEIEYANAALGSIGCEEDILILEKHIKSRIRDVRDSSISAIERIQERAK